MLVLSTIDCASKKGTVWRLIWIFDLVWLECQVFSLAVQQTLTLNDYFYVSWIGYIFLFDMIWMLFENNQRTCY